MIKIPSASGFLCFLPLSTPNRVSAQRFCSITHSVFCSHPTSHSAVLLLTLELPAKLLSSGQFFMTAAFQKTNRYWQISVTLRQSNQGQSGTVVKSADAGAISATPQLCDTGQRPNLSVSAPPFDKMEVITGFPYSATVWIKWVNIRRALSAWYTKGAL